jgi:tetratricopeptide (TPR) repeat protein
MVSTLSSLPVDGQSTPPNPNSAQPPWIYAPWLDLLIGCGAWSAPLLLLTGYVAGSQTAAWSFVFYLLALLFNYPHFMATAYRAYHSYDEFSKYRFFTVHVAVLLCCAGLIAHLWYPLLPWIFTLYIFWSPWHYSGQNFGLLMMFARRAGIVPSESERQALHLSFVASYLMLLFSFNTGNSGDALVLSLGLPVKFTLPARAMLALFFLCASGWALISLARRAAWKSLLPSMTLVSTQFLWFLLPGLIELLSGKEVPQTRYSSGILAVLHSAQYLWITCYYQDKEARAVGKSSWSFPKYLLTLVAGGIALFVPGPWIVSRVFHADFATSFLTFTALVNLHHFLLDGAIWKLRDSRIASLLLNKRETLEKVALPQRSPLVRAGAWLAGATPAARALRIAVITLLLLWGGLDRLRFYWANASGNLKELQRAVKLNPDDSLAQTRLARAAEASGDREMALAALQRAAQVNPRNLSVQEAYARGLITAGRDAEAYAFYQQVLSQSPQSADALVNYGLLAQRLGHPAEAVDSWQRAVTVDPLQVNAQLYLAQALEQRGEGQAAARHFRSYLEIVAKHPEQHRGELRTVISVLVKVADADAASNRSADALRGYQAAAQFAEKLGDPSLQSLAVAHAAESQERAGAPADAARSFQQALHLDETMDDPRGAAIDWFNYAQFLHRQKQPEQLVYACLAKAEELLRTTPGQELSALVKAREDSAGRLRADGRALPLDTSRLASTALGLPLSSFQVSPH